MEDEKMKEHIEENEKRLESGWAGPGIEVWPEEDGYVMWRSMRKDARRHLECRQGLPQWLMSSEPEILALLKAKNFAFNGGVFLFQEARLSGQQFSWTFFHLLQCNTD
jgi:hypothetical protein